MKKNKQKVVFFFPWREVSGGPFYLTRLANDLATNNKEYDVYYVDYRYGISYSLITSHSIKIIEFEDEWKEFYLFRDEAIILVAPIYWAYRLPKCNENTKIVFFNWHTECIPVLKREWGCTNHILDDFLNLVSETSSVFFMDRSHLMAQNKYGYMFKETYVPAVVPLRENRVSSKGLVNTNERNIAILGRLCWDKIFAVLDLLDNIIALRDGKKTNIYIIGDGDNKYRLNRAYPQNMHIELCGTMEMSKILKLLKNKVDVLFAMGLSVLDGASIGLPAVIIPNDTKPFSCNRYTYVYETKGLILGWSPDQIDDLEIPTHSLEEIFDDIYVKNRKREIGNECYSYCLNNHTNNVDSFCNAMGDSTLRYGKLMQQNKRISLAVLEIIKKIRQNFGEKDYSLRIFGVPIYSRTSIGHYKKNIYLLGIIPFLRIDCRNNSRNYHLLVFYWLIMGVKELIAKNVVREERHEIKA